MKMLIGGQKVNSENGATIDVINPANGQFLDTVPQASKNDIDRAVQLSKSGQKEWASIPLHERSIIIQ